MSKTLRYVIITTCIWVQNLHAQGLGYYTFTTLEPSVGINAPILDSEGVPLFGAQYRALLYAGLSQSSLAPTILGATANEVAYRPLTANPGYILSANVYAPAVPGTAQSWVQVRVWDGTLGLTYEEVVRRQLGGYGESKVFSLIAGSSDTTIWPAQLVGLESFSIRPVVPEPATILLLGFGAVVLFARKILR